MHNHRHERVRDRQTDRDRETETDRETATDRQAGRQAGRQTEAQTDTDTDTETVGTYRLGGIITTMHIKNFKKYKTTP